jgi:hypothetical protein
MLSASGKQFEDWSATYRLFEKDRINLQKLFAPVVNGVIENSDDNRPLYAMMDDTLIRKRGRKVSGTGWKRDPLGPAFHTNFVWGQRYLQMSVALPDFEEPGRARGIPIDFCHAPSPRKPRKNAPSEEWDEYKKQQKKTKLTVVGAARLEELRRKVLNRKIVCAVDGGYTNKEMFKTIPDNTVLIGRIRKDASLFDVPEQPNSGSRGRKRYYGARKPTPEQIRQDDSIPWQSVQAYAAGKVHDFEVKSVSPVRWKSSANRDMLLVIIRPLAYRPRKGAKLLYRDPAYILCSDPSMPLHEILQAYLWRWEIEVNFRDEKTVFGVGEAQVRTAAAVKSAPSFIVASYAFLLLAAHNLKVRSSALPAPKWYPHNPMRRCSTQNILSLFRAQSWGFNFNSNKSGFVSFTDVTRTHFFSKNSLPSAVCYARK